MSSKILKEAMLQQKEIEEEEAREQNPNGLVFREEHVDAVEDDDDDDFDNFGGFSETQSQYVDFEVGTCHSSFYLFLIQSYLARIICRKGCKIRNFFEDIPWHFEVQVIQSVYRS